MLEGWEEGMSVRALLLTFWTHGLVLHKGKHHQASSKSFQPGTWSGPDCRLDQISFSALFYPWLSHSWHSSLASNTCLCPSPSVCRFRILFSSSLSPSLHGTLGSAFSLDSCDKLQATDLPHRPNWSLWLREVGIQGRTMLWLGYHVTKDSASNKSQVWPMKYLKSKEN